MDDSQNSIFKAMRLARHDYLNELQIILLYIEMNKLPEAKAAIHQATSRLRQSNALEKLELPKTTLWLSVFPWSFEGVITTIHHNIQNPVSGVDDGKLCAYLDVFADQIKEASAADREYSLLIAVKSVNLDWSISFTIEGEAEKQWPSLPESEHFKVDETITRNQWTFTIRGQ